MLCSRPCTKRTATYERMNNNDMQKDNQDSRGKGRRMKPEYKYAKTKNILTTQSEPDWPTRMHRDKNGSAEGGRTAERAELTPKPHKSTKAAPCTTILQRVRGIAKQIPSAFEDWSLEFLWMPPRSRCCSSRLELGAWNFAASQARFPLVAAFRRAGYPPTPQGPKKSQKFSKCHTNFVKE